MSRCSQETRYLAWILIDKLVQCICHIINCAHTKMEFVLELKFHLDFHPGTWPRQWTLTNGSDVKYVCMNVFPRCCEDPRRMSVSNSTTLHPTSTVTFSCTIGTNLHVSLRWIAFFYLSHFLGQNSFSLIPCLGKFAWERCRKTPPLSRAPASASMSSAILKTRVTVLAKDYGQLLRGSLGTEKLRLALPQSPTYLWLKWFLKPTN